MLWVVVTLCFFGFLRSGEVTGPSDSALRGCKCGQRLKLPDPESSPQDVKNRSFRKGVDIVVGWTQSKLCPVTEMLAYLVTRRAKRAFYSNIRMVGYSQNLFCGGSSSGSIRLWLKPTTLCRPLLQNWGRHNCWRVRSQ